MHKVLGEKSARARGEGDSKNSLSFRITSKVANKVVSSMPNNFNIKDECNKSEVEDKDYIIAAEGKELKSTKQKKDSSKIVIPMIVKNKWLNGDDSSGEKIDELNRLAMTEILEDLNSGDESETTGVSSIPLMMRNRLPPPKDDGVVMDEKYDISIRPEESTLEDYGSIPVKSFGTAMLRGMGWSEGKPIGGSKKSLCEPIEYIPRHKGLGLGAEKIEKEAPARKRKLGEALPDEMKFKPIVEKDGRVRHIKKVGEEVKAYGGFTPGSCVTILKGPHKNLYGKIIAVDEDTSRICVKLSLSGEVIQVSQYNVCLVDKIPSKIEGRDTGNSSYDLASQGSNCTKKSKKEKDHVNGTDIVSNWMEQDIRVRIISRSFMGGKYYNKKANIIDVTSVDRCTCKTDENKILDNIREEYLETVVPKIKGSYVLILRGKYKGRHARLLERNKGKCLATVQLISNKHVTKVSFDYIAEFTGELPHDEFL